MWNATCDILLHPVEKWNVYYKYKARHYPIFSYIRKNRQNFHISLRFFRRHIQFRPDHYWRRKFGSLSSICFHFGQLTNWRDTEFKSIRVSSESIILLQSSFFHGLWSMAYFILFFFWTIVDLVFLIATRPNKLLNLNTRFTISIKTVFKGG